MQEIKLCKKGKEKTFCLRKLTEADIPAALRLQDVVLDFVADPAILQPTSREELADSCEKESAWGVFDGEEMAAWCAFVPLGDAARSLAADGGRDADAVLTFDGVEVLPAYHGYGMQRMLLGKAADVAEDAGAKYVMATVSPKNPYSHKNFEAMGFRVVKEYIKYGYPRFLLEKSI